MDIRMSTSKHRKPLWIAILLVVGWFMVSGVTGPLFGQLSTVQKNDNSKFLPSSSETERFNAAAAGFNSGANKSLPELVLFVGDATPATVGATNAFLQTLGSHRSSIRVENPFHKSTQNFQIS
jgi:hypothetical protein